MRSQRNKEIVLLTVVFILIVKEGKTLPESATEDLPLRRKIEYKAQDFKDPFWPPKKEKEEEKEEKMPKEEAVAVPLPNLIIQGLVWGSGLPQVIINNEVLKIGDTIEGVRIIDIDKDGITVFFGNREYNLLSPATVYTETSRKQ